MKKNIDKTNIAISLLNADFLNLKHVLDLLKKFNLNWIHYDVMDYDFVPNLSFGPHILQNIVSYMRPSCNDLIIDCHMMVKIKNIRVETYLKPFIFAGATSITMHYESLTKVQLDEFFLLKAKYNIKIALAISPQTPIEKIYRVLNKLDMVLIMSVHPGFGGQKFIPASINKINKLEKYIKEHNIKLLIQVDGGINNTTFKLCSKADALVVGSYLLKAASEVEFKAKLAGLYV